jgi:hypothetical protein
MELMNKMEKSSKIVDITPSIDAKLYNSYTVTCEYLTSNKDVKIYYPSNKYSIVIKDRYSNLNNTLGVSEPGVKNETKQAINYSHNVYKNLSWAMQNL